MEVSGSMVGVSRFHKIACGSWVLPLVPTTWLALLMSAPLL